MADQYHGKPCKHCGGTLRYLSNCRCVFCQLKKSRAWHAANQDKRLAQMRARYAANRKSEITRARKWNVENKERVAAGQKKRYVAQKGDLG